MRVRRQAESDLPSSPGEIRSLVHSLRVHQAKLEMQYERQELISNILRVLNRGSDDVSVLIREVLLMIRKWTGFDAVGLRIRRGNDFPYYEQSGFSEEFLLEENFLCERRHDGSVVLEADGRPVLECACGLVLSGATDPRKPFFTEGGSFWINRTTDLLKLPADVDPRANPRNQCIHSGYLSVALIPVRSGDEIIGLLQLNDRREGQLSEDMVRFFEGLDDQIGLTIKRMQAEQELKSLNETLERRVAERSAEAERRAEQLRQLASELTLAEQRERQRLAQVLHDGLQQILVGAKYRLALFDRSQGTKQTALEVADIIDDAIETSRSLTAELSPPILHQSGLLPALEWLVRWMQDKHGLVVDLIAGEKIHLNQGELDVFLFQAIRELLFNVIKHAGVRQSRVRISRHDDQLQIAVEDEGSGFDQSQLRTAGGKTGGFGLFNLSERLSMLDGRMTIDSSPGKGSRILLNVPVASSNSETAEAPMKSQATVSVAASMSAAADEAQSAKQMRIVLVDDHVMMRQGLAGLLQAEPDMEIVGQASNGESAVNLIRDIKPDVVLMDISMPGMNGIQATRIIHSEFPEIHIIGLSMFQEGEQARAMREAGAEGYVTKSGPSEAVITAIRSCFE
jgi:signal transduction histidine kinase